MDHIAIHRHVCGRGLCATATSGVTSTQLETEDLVVDLPALVIDIDADGNPSVGNVPLAQLGDTFAPGAMDAAHDPQRHGRIHDGK